MDLLPMIELLFTQYGLLGLFIASIVGNATVLFPMPIDFFVLLVATLAQNPVQVLALGVVSGIGAAIGEMSAYLLGYLGIKGFERAKKRSVVSIDEIRERLQYRGMWVVFLGALTPFPFDIIGVAAGMIKYDPRRFFLAALAGKVIRYCLLAYAGFYGLQFIKAWFFIG